jgi:hypothetical protein
MMDTGGTETSISAARFIVATNRRLAALKGLASWQQYSGSFGSD